MPVWFLSDLNIAGLKLVPDSHLGTEQKSIQDPAQAQSGTGLSETGGTTARQGTTSDKLVSDKPGEELAPDAAIWRLYAEEAMEYDNDLVANRNKNLDTMLLFAGLFSAILASFLVESSNMLQPDQAETSTMLLLYLAQSQWRIETGNANNTALPAEIPPFTPTTSARWINGLWFTSLVLSLGAAMMAMVAKEWLTSFTDSAPRNPYKYAIKRQARLDAFRSWHALRIIDFLPTLLHISLLIFTAGLIIQLSLLDWIITAIMIAASATMTLCYVGAVVLGVLKEDCPYRTRVSKHIGGLFDRLRTLIDRLRTPKEPRKPKKAHADTKNTTAKDLRALEWLSVNARDPTVRDSAYQAFAGLRLRTLKPWDLGHGSQDKTGITQQQTIKDHHAAMKMGVQIVHRLSDSLSRYPRELAFCRGTSIARYAGAVAEIYRYACESLSQWERLSRSDDNHFQRWMQLQMELNYDAGTLKRAAFSALDTIWDDECPPLSANTYACLTAAELRLTGFALDNVGESSSTGDTGGNDSGQQGRSRVIDDKQNRPGTMGDIPSRAPGHTRRHTSISVISDRNSNLPYSDEATLPKLRARSSRALCRAAFQLLLHSNGSAPIGTFSLINLLEAIRDIASKDGLDLPGVLSTHHSQFLGAEPGGKSEESESPTIVVHVTGMGESHALEPDQIGDTDGLLAGLTVLLGSASTKSLPKLDHVVVNALGAIGPKLIGQWVKKRANNSPDEYSFTWVSHFDLDDPRWCTERAIMQLFRTTNFAISSFNDVGICELPDIALQSLYNRAHAPESARWLAHGVIWADSLQKWIDTVGRVEPDGLIRRPWIQTAKKNLLGLLAIQNRENTTLFHSAFNQGMSWSEGDADHKRLLTVLHMMSTTPAYPGDIKKLLVDIRTLACLGGYSTCFIGTSDGFRYLQKIGIHPDYVDHVAQTIMTLIVDLTNNHSGDGTWIQAEAIPGFLDAVSFICQNIGTTLPHGSREGLSTFIQAIMSTLKQLDLIVITPNLQIWETLDELEKASKYIGDRIRRAQMLFAQARMRSRVHAIRKAAGTMDRLLAKSRPRIQEVSFVELLR